MNKIICPVDFSEASLNALEFAIEIGKKFHSHITLFHVFTERDFNKVVGQDFVGKSFKELMAMATNKLKKISDQLNEDYNGQITCSYQLELGELIDKLEDTIKNEGYDLLVMGTTGVSKMKGVSFGSNTEDAIEDIGIPILCVPKSANYQGFQKITYASDFMEEDRIAIQEVISFATMYDSRISVLHINLGDDDAEYEKFVENLKSFIQYYKIGFVNKKFKDDVGAGIEEHLVEEKSDLLAVFKKQRSFVGSIFHKSITKVLSFSSQKPLLVLKLESH